MNPLPYDCHAGLHPVTAAIRNQLSFYGVKTHTGDGEISEAMLLGIGGGLGAGYILWGAPSHESLVLMLNFRNNWQYPLRFVTPLCERLGLEAEFLETGSANKASKQLHQALSQGKPAAVWVKHALLPHWHLDHHECWTHGYVVNIFAVDEAQGLYLLDDKAPQPYEIGDARLRQARGGIPSFKNRLLTLAPPTAIDLEPAVHQGLADCVEHLSASSDSFGLPAWRKWSRMLTHEKSDKGWPKAFRQPTGLFLALSTIYEAAGPTGGNGGNLRDLYADFLGEARQVTGNEALGEAEELYRRLAQDWLDLAEAALPDEVEAFRQAKELLNRRHTIQNEKGGQGDEELRETGEAIGQLAARSKREFPLTAPQTAALLGDLQPRVQRIFEREVQAREALHGAL